MVSQEKRIEYNLNKKIKRHLLGISKNYYTGISSFNRNAYRKKLKAEGKLNRGDRASQIKRYRLKHGIKALAHRIVHNAIRSGILIRPNKCSICLLNASIQAHHDDYNKPLKVLWVCQNCHNEIHRTGGKNYVKG